MIEIIQAVAANFFLLIVLIAITIITIVIGRTVTRVKTSSSAARMAELDIDSKKLEMVSKKMHLENLRDATMVLTDNEQNRLESIRRDTAALSRKTLAGMSEIEARTKRLELGTNLSKLAQTLGKIKRYEKKLFKSV